jgi:hypothetical protein
VALKSPIISMLLVPPARTDWLTAASAAVHSRQYARNGATGCTTRSATGSRRHAAAGEAREYARGRHAAQVRRREFLEGDQIGRSDPMTLR